ncbi:MAG: AmmeMemoRadiSam system radical SAM enzyme [Bacteroidales bacterium]
MRKREFIKCMALGSGAVIFNPVNTFSSFNNPPFKEASYYVVTPRGIKCQICPNECDIKPGETGNCHTRLRKNDKLYAMAYSNPCAINVDPIEKKPLYQFFPGSTAYSVAIAGCNLVCLNCQNWTISQTGPDKTENYNLSPKDLVDQAIKNNCKSIAYTYSEPIVSFEWVRDSAIIAREKKIKTVLVSNGYINEKPLRELCKYLDASNVDLKSFSEDIYLKLNGGKLEPILRTLKIMKELNVWLEITNLVIPSWTDDLKMIREMCKWLKTNGLDDVPLHFSRFFPLYKLTQLPPTPAATLENARKIALEEGLHYVYADNLPGTKSSNTFCPSCKASVIERKGFVITKNIVNSGKCGLCGKPIAGVWD